MDADTFFMFQSPSLRGSGRFRTAGGQGGENGNSFQSPSLRGSGRFRLRNVLENDPDLFQSPSLRGSGRFRRDGESEDEMEDEVSIPFIAGQWSLPTGAPWSWARRSTFQSPSLRGSGRFSINPTRARRIENRFNPLHCGAVVASGCFGSSSVYVRQVSIPFIAGQWSLLMPTTLGSVLVLTFQSPSLRGSGRFKWLIHLRLQVGGTIVSIPFIAGQWSLRRLRSVAWPRADRVSIPFIAGQWSLHPRTTPFPFCRVLLRKRRLPCDHIICTRLPF